jgi:hypothetical protein
MRQRVLLVSKFEMIIPTIKLPHKYVKKEVACKKSGSRNVDPLHFHFLLSFDIQWIPKFPLYRILLQE